MKLTDRIDEVLEHYDYALVSLTGESTDNVVCVDNVLGMKIGQLYNYLTIVYGAERVSKAKSKVRIDR